MRSFYEKYFDAVCNEKYSSVNNPGFESYFLTIGGETKLEIMTHTKLKKVDIESMVNGICHIAFSVGSREAVMDITNRLVADGYKLNSPARVTGDGYFESNICDPDGNYIEITE